MSVKFPLYDELAKQALADPGDINIKNLVATLSNLSVEHASNIFLLTLHYNSLHGTGKYANVPYGGSVMNGGKGVLFQIHSIPPALQQIYLKYIEKTS